MIKLENFEVVGWEHAIRGMRNPKNSWDRSDNGIGCDGKLCRECEFKPSWCGHTPENIIGPNDHDLMMKLRNAGTDHRKFMRMIVVYADITAPLYWWKEYDTYKVGTVANSCSTMHTIMNKEFTLDDFSHDHLIPGFENVLETQIIARLNKLREEYVKTKTQPVMSEANREALLKLTWWQIIQLLPSSYNQKRTVMLNYEVLANMYRSRKTHKLDEWVEFCKWIETLPYSEIITGGKKDE